MSLELRRQFEHTANAYVFSMWIIIIKKNPISFGKSVTNSCPFHRTAWIFFVQCIEQSDVTVFLLCSALRSWILFYSFVPCTEQLNVCFTVCHWFTISHLNCQVNIYYHKLNNVRINTFGATFQVFSGGKK